MIRDHLGMLAAWVATVKAIESPPADFDIRILHDAEQAIRVLAFTIMPEGPENALALFVLAEAFREWRGDEITEEERKQVDHALTLSSIATERARRAAA